MTDFSSTRTHAGELPAVLEIEALMEREARRAYPAGKEDAHYADFTLALRWLDILGLPTEAFTTQAAWEDVVAGMLGLPERVAGAMLARSDDAELAALMHEITAYLGEEDAAHPSDAIYVFGSKSIARMQKAVELYRASVAPRIFVTGGMPIYEKREEAEAETYKRYGAEQGVPVGSIFTHDTAISIADNVRGGLNRMDELGLPYSTLTLVTAWFAMRRSWVMMKKYVPADTALYRANAPVTVGGDYDPASWWKNANGIKMVFNEFVKMRISEALNSS